MIRRIALMAVLGLGVFASPASADLGDTYIDRSCTAALKAERPWLTAEQRNSRCTVVADQLSKDPPKFPSTFIAGGSVADTGSWRVEVGTALWGFTLEAYYTRIWIPPLYNTWSWTIQKIVCDTHEMIYMSYVENRCGSWRGAAGDLVGGVLFTVSYTVPPIEVKEPQYAVFRFPIGRLVTYEQGRGQNP